MASDPYEGSLSAFSKRVDALQAELAAVTAERDAAIRDRDALLKAIELAQGRAWTPPRVLSVFDTASAIRGRVAAERRTP